jgi:hypothetical protein
MHYETLDPCLKAGLASLPAEQSMIGVPLRGTPQNT